MDKTRWIIVGIICALGLGGLIAFTKKDTVNVDTANPAEIITGKSSEINDHVYGNANAKVIVFEYADYQCPACGAAYTTVSAVQKLYKDKVAFVFRNFPLTSIHPNALAAATVAEAAGKQGKFWEMHDLLFTKRSEWVNLSADQRNTVFLTYAKQLGLNTDTFTTDQTSSAVAEKIDRDRALGKKADVGETPSFLVGNEKLDSDAVDQVINGKSDALTSKIDAALKAVGETPPTQS